MNRDEVLRLAKEAGIRTGGHPMNPWSVYPSDLERFAALVAAHEREQCAKACDEKGFELLRWWGDGQSGAACQECAAAIRARGEP